jgi:hypothetical protein
MDRQGAVRHLSTLVAVSAAVLIGLPPRPAIAATPVCLHTGTVRPNPGLSTTTKSFAFSFKGTVECRTSDGSTIEGVETGGGRATGDCAKRTASAPWTIRWRNGRTTVLSVEFFGVGNVIVTRGTVKKGPFAGHTMTDVHMLSGFNLLDCMSTAGVTKATYTGALTITG